MTNFAQTRDKIDALNASYFLPVILAANVAALVAIDQLVGIPEWVKTAAAVFLTF